jgi:hypothetical protein
MDLTEVSCRIVGRSRINRYRLADDPLIALNFSTATADATKLLVVFRPSKPVNTCRTLPLQVNASALQNRQDTAVSSTSSHSAVEKSGFVLSVKLAITSWYLAKVCWSTAARLVDGIKGR